MTVTTIGFFFLIFFHLQPCLLLLWDFSEWHQHKDLCYFNTIWKSLQAKEFFCGSDSKEENWVRSLNQKDPLEKEMAPHSSILAWKIPWMEEPGRLKSRGSQRVGQNWATSLFFFLGELKSFNVCTGRVNESSALNAFSFEADSSNQLCELLFQELSPTLSSPPCSISSPLYPLMNLISRGLKRQ